MVAKEAFMAATLGLSVSVATGQMDWWVAPGFLLGSLLVVQVGELLTCFAHHTRDARREYDWNRAVLKKVFTWLLWVCTLILDGIAHLVPYMLPEVHLPLLESPSFLPFSITFTVIFLIAEMTRLAYNVKAYQGRDSDADTVIAALKVISFINKMRAGGGLTHNRWTDNITASQVREVQAYMSGSGPPPPWLTEVVPGELPSPEVIKQIPNISPKTEEPQA